MKKVTLKKVKERLAEVFSEYDDLLQEMADYAAAHPDRTMKDRAPAACTYVQDGVSHTFYKCPHCGKVFEANDRAFDSCPKCGAEIDSLRAYNYGRIRQKNYHDHIAFDTGSARIVRLIGCRDGILTGCVGTCRQFFIPDKPNCPDGKDMEGTYIVPADEVRMEFYFSWSRETGFHTADSPASFCNKKEHDANMNILKNIWQTEYRYGPKNVDQSYTLIEHGIDWKALFTTDKLTFPEAVATAEEEWKRSHASHRRRTVKGERKEHYLSYCAEAEKPHPDPWTLIEGNPIGKLVNRYSGMTEYIAACPECKTFQKIVASDQEHLICPNCGSVLTAHQSYQLNDLSRRVNRTIATVELTDEKTILFRIWFTTVTCDPDEQSFTVLPEEQKRIFCDETGIYIYSIDYEGKWCEEPARKYDYHRCIKTWEPNELTRIVRDSVIPYSGFDLVMNAQNTFQLPCIGSYEREWYKDHRLELFLKAGLFENKVFTPSGAAVYLRNVPEKKTELLDILGINSRELAFAKRYQLSWEDALYGIRYMRSDPHLTEEDAYELVQIGDYYSYDRIISRGIRLSKAVGYLKSVREHQCIEMNEAVRLWTDYLNMAYELDYDMYDKSRKFPFSLKKAHDVASYAFKFIKQQKDDERFQQQMERNMDYQDKGNGKYQVLLPKTPEEIVQEGARLHHYVASYVRSVINGDTLIAFVRRKDAPEVPFVTMEIRDKKIPQLYGACDRIPDMPVREYVRDYAKRKGLALCCN